MEVKFVLLSIFYQHLGGRQPKKYLGAVWDQEEEENILYS